MSIAVQLLTIATIAAPSYVRQQNGHDKESLSQLAASINQHGLLQPIVVRPASEDDKPAEWVIVAGRRRLAACKLAGMTDIPALVTNTDEAKAYELEIAENIQREQMTLADTARAVRTLMTIYDNAKKVGEVLNKSPAWVSKHLAVTSSKCPAVILDLMDRGIVSDLETLILLKQIAEMPTSHPAAASTMSRMLRIAHEGNMNRQIARDALSKLKTPAPAPAPTAGVSRLTTSQTVTAAPTQETDPATTFTVTLPIELLELVELKGGTDWLVGLIKTNSES
jgi:ParB family chromosome partitioning protein